MSKHDHRRRLVGPGRRAGDAGRPAAPVASRADAAPSCARGARTPIFWKRRVSIICQLQFKQDTDLDLLYANIEPDLADRDLFVRKAIGWALRQHAWTDPTEVARYVRANEESA